MQSTQRNPRRALTIPEAAAHCQVSAPTLTRWIQAGRLRAFRTAGGHARIHPEEFRRFLKAHGMPSYSKSEAEIRVLIVDDEPALIEVLSGYLRVDARPFKIEAATDGFEALIKIGSSKPAILILDIMMPGLDGVEVCRRLRAAPETRDIKILGITGHEGLIPGLLAAGAQACLTKPIPLQEFLRAVNRLLSGSEE